ncbi:MAG: hypothetical protein WDO56_16020 [Gammaproteobacteria bacterium]
MKAIFLVLMVIFGGACVPMVRADAPELEVCGELADTYFSKSLKQTIDAFTGHDLETQHKIYLCGHRFMHPPALYLAAPFASEGEPAAIFLKRKLAAASSTSTIRDILNVYSEMERQQTYDAKHDTALRRLRDRKISTIRDSYWLEYCQGILKKMG